MNRRIVPFSLVLAGSLLAYACSSSDDSGGTPTPGDDSGTSSGSSGQSSSGSSGAEGGTDGSSGSDGSSSSSGNPIEGVTAAVPAVNFTNTPPVSTQGPIWGKDNNFYFSAVGDPSFLVQFKPALPAPDNTNPIINGEPGGYLAGNTYDVKTSKILTAQATNGGGGTILATTLPATTAPLTLNFGIDGGAAAFDSPQDLVSRADGLIFVTDGAQNGAAATTNHIWRLRPTATAGTYDALDYATDGRPNGIALSGDGKTLFVSFTNPQNAIPHVDKFTVGTGTDGALSARTKFSDIGTMDQGATALGGIALDSAGNLYVAYANGVDVLKPDGTKWGHLTVPVATGVIVTNVGFGGADLKTLYVTSGAGLFTAAVKVAGVAQ